MNKTLQEWIWSWCWGECIECFCLIRHPRCSPFKALRVLLVFEEPAELWSELLMMSGASSVRQHQAEKDSSGTYNTWSSTVLENELSKQTCWCVCMVTPLTLINPEGHGFNPPFPLGLCSTSPLCLLHYCQANVSNLDPYATSSSRWSLGNILE